MSEFDWTEGYEQPRRATTMRPAKMRLVCRADATPEEQSQAYREQQADLLAKNWNYSSKIINSTNQTIRATITHILERAGQDMERLISEQEILIILNNKNPPETFEEWAANQPAPETLLTPDFHTIRFPTRLRYWWKHRGSFTAEQPRWVDKDVIQVGTYMSQFQDGETPEAYPITYNTKECIYKYNFMRYESWTDVMENIANYVPLKAV